MTSKADKLGVGASFGRAPAISARRAAIAAVTDAPTEGVVKQEFRLDLISDNPDNPREELKNIREMADTLEAVGQITAITLATVEAYLKERPGRAHKLKDGAQYVVVDGHRRLAGARLLEWETLRAIVDDAQVASDERLLEAAFIANTQREDMTDLEQAEALKSLVKFHGSQAKTAKRLGISQGVISQRLSLLALSPELQADLNAGKRTVEHVRGLAKLTPEQQKATADQRAAASKTHAKDNRSAPEAAGKPPAEPEPSSRSYYGVIDPPQDKAEHPAPAAPPAAALPAQSTAPAGESPTPTQPTQAERSELASAIGDASNALEAARYLAERFDPEELQVIVSYIQSLVGADGQATQGQTDRAGS